MDSLRLYIILLMVTIGSTLISNAENLREESKACKNGKIDRRCNPYQSHLIYVDRETIADAKDIPKLPSKPIKNPPKPKLNKGLSLTNAVNRFIDNQLSKQEIRAKRRVREYHPLECEYIHLYLTQDRSSRVYGGVKDIFPYIMMDRNQKYFLILRIKEHIKPSKKRLRKKRRRIAQKAKSKRHKKRKKRKRIPKIKISQILHKVKKGETLSGIAYRYKSSVKDIKDLNDMGDDAFIKIGDILRVPSKEKLEFTKKEFSKIRALMGKYKVQKGESLGYLSKFFRVKISDIAELNHFDRNRKLIIGEEVLLPLTQSSIDNLVDIRRIEKEMEERDRKRRARLEAMRKYSKSLKYTKNNDFKHKIRVVATAYTSHPSQTDETPYLAAWNNPIRPGMKIIAVSPDLIRRYGLTNGIKVKISGLPGIYTVRDNMNKRLRNHIDIYMGDNIRRALRWGRRRVVLYW